MPMRDLKRSLFFLSPTAAAPHADFYGLFLHRPQGDPQQPGKTHNVARNHSFVEKGTNPISPRCRSRQRAPSNIDFHATSRWRSSQTDTPRNTTRYTTSTTSAWVPLTNGPVNNPGPSPAASSAPPSGRNSESAFANQIELHEPLV